jgi:hypothetical protein
MTVPLVVIASKSKEAGRRRSTYGSDEKNDSSRYLR